MASPAPDLGVAELCARVQADFAALGQFLRSPMLLAEIREDIRLGQIEASSPWLTPKTVHAYCGRSPADVARIAKAGIIKQFYAGDSPRWLKTEIDNAIKTGHWPQAGTGSKTKTR